MQDLQVAGSQVCTFSKEKKLPQVFVDLGRLVSRLVGRIRKIETKKRHPEGCRFLRSAIEPMYDYEVEVKWFALPTLS